MSKGPHWNSKCLCKSKVNKFQSIGFAVNNQILWFLNHDEELDENDNMQFD
jgi:hypothetical protein